MANRPDPELDKENAQFPMERKFDLPMPNASGATKSFNGFLPQLIIPQLRVPQSVTAESIAAQEEQHRATDAHNEMLLNEIKRRREQSDNQMAKDRESYNGMLPGGITIPKLRGISGQPFEIPQLNIPLLNKLRSQNNLLDVAPSLEVAQSLDVSQLERDVNTLKIGSSSTVKCPSEPTALIDLTTTVIAVQKDAVPREAASKVLKKKAAVTEHFDIPFISCDGLRNRLSADLLSKKRQNDESKSPAIKIVEKCSVVGKFMDRTVGYPNPRKPQLKYAATPLELQHLKMYMREDYGSNIKRFRFDTPSPDEKVKEALQKSLRISRT